MTRPFKVGDRIYIRGGTGKVGMITKLEVWHGVLQAYLAYWDPIDGAVGFIADVADLEHAKEGNGLETLYT